MRLGRKHRRRGVATLRAAAGLTALLALAATPARAQYLFGQNKVIYGAKDWKVLETPRLDVYYYAGEEQLAQVLADFAEKTCIEYEAYFRHKFDDKIPLVLYASHHDFKQTNIIDAMISDYVGGFTESIRGRVAIPHTGSMTQLCNVTRHELVHAFMNDKLAHLFNAKRRYSAGGPPLWFSEGLAEYVALRTPDSEAHMFLRDLVVNGNLVELPDLWRIAGSFLMYKEGESLTGYIAGRFGDEALVQLLENWWRSDRFEVVLQLTLGISTEELNRDWVRYLKRRYYPAVLDADWADHEGAAATRGRGLNTRPAPYAATQRADGTCDFVFLSSRSGSVDVVYARPAADSAGSHEFDWLPYRFDTLVRGGRSDRVESIPPFASGMEIHDHRLAFTTKSGAHDALVLWDLQHRGEIARFKFDELVALASPTWSPDGRAIAFAALDRRGWPDLYRLTLADGALERLTFDPADDRDPDWSHDGTRLAWSSDRDAAAHDGVYHLWTLDVATGVARPLTSGTEDDAAPAWSPDDTSLLYTSDAGGQTNVYLYECESGAISQVTSTLGGIFTPEWLPDGKSFLASSFSNISFNVVRFQVERRRRVEPAVPAQALVADAARAAPPVSVTAGAPADWVRTARLNSFQNRAYRVRFGLDFVRTAVAFDPDFASATGGQLGLTDLLGNHQVFLHASNDANDVSEFWQHLNVGATYVNLSHRVNYSLGAFNLTSVYDPRLDLYRYERRTGMLVGASYPLSRFRRIESTLVGRVSKREVDLGRQSVLISDFTSFVHDNTLWSVAGPTDGTRFNLTFGGTVDVTGTGRGGTSLQADLRRYTPLPMRSVLALRGIGRANWGDDLGYFYMGGPFDVRGYPRRSLFGTRTLLFNGELRFPLVDRLLVGLPFNNIELGGFRGALFADAAYAGPPLSLWAGSLGMGFELGLGGGFIARWDLGRRHDFHHLEPQSFSRFFLGWDY